MKPDHIRHEILAFDPDLPINKARTPPSAWYTDPAYEPLERAAVFGHSWQLVARVDQLAAPRSYVAGVHFGTPWVVVRGDDGVLRALHNVCRHKATPVARGCGAAASGVFVCPYHGWRYRLDGSLKSAPRMAGIGKLDLDTLALPPMGVCTWGPLVFIHGDPSAAPLVDGLAALDGRLGASRWDRLAFHSSKTYDVAANWKVFADNYLDGGYHVAHMHPSLHAQLDMATYETELFPSYSIQSSAAAHIVDDGLGVDPAARIGSGALYAFVYPNLMLNRYGPVLDINLVLPTGPGSCRVLFDFYFDPEVPDAERFVADSVAQSHLTQLEDIEVSELVQTGLASPSYDRGPYAPRVEMAVHHFHRLLAADLRRAVGSAAGGS